MSGEVTVTAERRFRHGRARVFRAFVEPAEFAQWRGSPRLARRGGVGAVGAAP